MPKKTLDASINAILEKKYPCYKDLNSDEKKKLKKWYIDFVNAYTNKDSKKMGELVLKVPSAVHRKAKCA